MAGNPYNGYSPRQREAKYRELKRLWRTAGGPSYEGPCMLCGDPHVATEPHSEDYSRPYRWKPPAMYWLCRYCHRARLHKRFANPARWEAFKAHIRRGGFASDLKQSSIKKEVERYQAVIASNDSTSPHSSTALRALRPRATHAVGEWWEALSTDARTLTDCSAMPRPDKCEQAV